MKKRISAFVAIAIILVNGCFLSASEKIGIDTNSWRFLADGGRIAQDELILDGTRELCRAFYLPLRWTDVKLDAKIKLEPGDGVLACGFLVRATDANTYYAVHFDRNNAILIRSDADSSWNEIKRAPIPGRKPQDWQEASLEIRGDLLTVFFEGRELFQATDALLTKSGNIGFYSNQGTAHIKDISVTGETTESDGIFVVPDPRWIHVCTDAGAGAYEAFPDVCRLKDGRLLCVFYAGYAHVSYPNEKLPRGGRICGCYSSDEGTTWSSPETIVDTPIDDRDPSVVQLPDGRILLVFFTYPGPEVDGVWRTETCLVESADNGKTWSPPRFLFKGVPVSQPVRILSDGTLLLPLYGLFDGQKCGAVSRSEDHGKTWSDPIVIPNGGKTLDAETDVIELKDGTLYAIQRPWMGVSRSKDLGKTWSVSEYAGFQGHCPYFLRTKNDVILLGLRLPGTCLRISRDECKTWSDPIRVDSHIGAYPSMVELDDGSILIVYYEEGAGSSIRAKKFRVTEKGVTWIPFASNAVPGLEHSGGPGDYGSSRPTIGPKER